MEGEQVSKYLFGPMILFNNWNAAERARWIDEAGEERITLSFYKYHPIDDPEGFRDELVMAWLPWDVLGRIYVAREGINAQMSVPAPQFNAFKEHLDSYPFLKGIRLNVAIEPSNKSFLKLKIKVRDKIVADGIDDPTFDASQIGAHLKARDFNALVESPDTVVVDMRNHYESEIGRFPTAITPEADTFREALTVAEAALEPHREDKHVVMYCTGGIRCEKASAYFKHRGFQKVYQLEGGIIEYLRQVKAEGLENKFKGKNFVFDERRAEKVSDDVIATCHLCDAPCDTHVNCRNVTCNMLFLQCAACAERLGGCCSETCRAFADLPIEQQRVLRKGKKEHQKIYRRKRIV
jgi:UPF0176 protein